MKKLVLKSSAFNGGEVLSREQLKKVMGGDGGSGNGSGSGGSPKIDACSGKSVGDSCFWTYQGTSYSGRCQSYMAQPLACSTLI